MFVWRKSPELQVSGGGGEGGVALRLPPQQGRVRFREQRSTDGALGLLELALDGVLQEAQVIPRCTLMVVFSLQPRM